MKTPLADFIRPKEFNDVFGQKHLLDKDCLFRKVIENNNIPNLIFYGPPGVGKTTVANIIASNSNMTLYTLNGTSASIEDIKNIIQSSNSILNEKKILLYLDEIQYLNKKQQQSLLEYVEKGTITLIASTTENPYFYIYPALISRCAVFEFKSLDADEIYEGLIKISNKLEIEYEKDALKLISLSCNGDMRKAINILEFIISSFKSDKKHKILKKDTLQIINKAHITYDKGQDKHYDNLSALMKSLRGSDPDAAIFYLAKMLSAGDLQAVCRRLLCSVNEDVGLAYPQLIPIVKSCVDSALQLGLPEARLPLANAVILIATAPKSNSSYNAYDLAQNDVNLGLGINTPRALQNTHFDGDNEINKGQNYLYPHDYKNHYVKQQYLPDDIKDKKYYKYGTNKVEQAAKKYWDLIKN